MIAASPIGWMRKYPIPSTRIDNIRIDPKLCADDRPSIALNASPIGTHLENLATIILLRLNTNNKIITIEWQKDVINASLMILWSCMIYCKVSLISDLVIDAQH